MVTGYAGSPRRRFGQLLDALFDEAWQLQRRRRRLIAALAVLLCTATACVVPAISGGQRDSSGSARGPAQVSSAALPLAGAYTSVQVVGGRLVVLGGTAAEPPLISGSLIALVDGRAAGTCTVGTVDPTSLALLSVVHGNCGDPSLYGEPVLPISTRSSTAGKLVDSVRIATADSAARDGYTLGPIVLSSPDCSECQVQWAYGDGALWIYAGATGNLARVSERTGQVEQRWRLPALDDALVAANADGLWIAPSVLSTVPLNLPSSQQRRYESLYHVSAGMPTARPVLPVALPGADWLVAAGHRVWLDVARSANSSQLWLLRGPHATPSVRARSLPGASRCRQIGAGPTMIVGNVNVGISCVLGNGGVIRLDPGARSDHTIARIPAPFGNIDPPTPQAALPAATLNHSFYYLQPAQSTPTAQTPDDSAVLYQVRLP